MEVTMMASFWMLTGAIQSRLRLPLNLRLDSSLHWGQFRLEKVYANDYGWLKFRTSQYLNLCSTSSTIGRLSHIGKLVFTNQGHGGYQFNTHTTKARYIHAENKTAGR